MGGWVEDKCQAQDLQSVGVEIFHSNDVIMTLQDLALGNCWEMSFTLHPTLCALAIKVS